MKPLVWFLGAVAVLAARPGLAAADLPACCAPGRTGLAPVEMVDQAGRHVRWPDGRPWVVTFFYSHCQDVCPLLLYHLRDAADRVPAADRRRIGFAAVTFDPERDTVQALPAIARNFELPADAFHVLTCSPVALADVTKGFGFDYRPDGQGGFKHVNLIAVMDGHGVVKHHFYGLQPDLDAVAKAAVAQL